MKIYKIKNTINNKVYIGQTTSVGDIRWLSHRSKLRKNISEAAKLGWVKRKANKVVKDV